MVAQRGDQQRRVRTQPGAAGAPDALAWQRRVEQRRNPMGAVARGHRLGLQALCPRQFGGSVADLGQRFEWGPPLLGAVSE